jgi:hypothetical protein
MAKHPDTTRQENAAHQHPQSCNHTAGCCRGIGKGRDQSGAHAHKDTNTTPGKVTLLTQQQQRHQAQNHTHLPRTHAVCAHKNRLHTKTTPSPPNPLYPHRNPHCPNKQVAPPPRPPPLLARSLACLPVCPRPSPTGRAQTDFFSSSRSFAAAQEWIAYTTLHYTAP